MKIRQYTAATMQEAILKIKVDLGPDAVILHTRKFKRGGFLGMFAQDMVEVLAAIDPNDGKSGDGEAKQNKGQAPAAPRKEWTVPDEPAPVRPVESTRPVPGSIDLGPSGPHMPAPAKEAAPKSFTAGLQAEQLAAARAELTATIPAAAEPAAQEPVGARVTGELSAPAAKAPAENSKLAEEVKDLKSTVSDLKAMLTTIAGHLDAQPRVAVQFPTILQKVYERLMACDVEPSVARGLVVYLQKEQPHLETFEELVDALEMPVSGLYQIAGAITPTPGEQKIVALVGPTGVGKTTTIAKLAANNALARNVNLALFTIDTYRVAAIEQLKTYGDIIGLPVEVVLTSHGLKEALRQHSGKDLILIDTAGRSPHNRMHLNELKSFLDFPQKRETHMVLSATTRLADLKQIVRNFAPTGVDRLIFTKTDETSVVGGIISIAHETGLPVSYITTGQSVPDDILVADQGCLARMLIQELKA